MKKTLAFIRKHCFKAIPLEQDSYLYVCTFCEKKDWLIDDIKHKRTCDVGKVLKEIKSCV